MTIQTTAVSNSATTVYTSTNNTAITYMQLTNETAGALTVDIHVIPSGDSLTTTNLESLTISRRFIFMGYDYMLLWSYLQNRLLSTL